MGLERRRAFLQLYSDRLEVLGTTAAALDIFHPVGKNAQPKSRRVSPPAALRGRFAGASCDLLSGLPSLGRISAADVVRSINLAVAGGQRNHWSDATVCRYETILALSSLDASPPYGFILLPGTNSSGFAMKRSSFSLSHTKSAPCIALE